jgi:pyruvate/2-oxoglutarate dehydrogenase complex dihydrolipoamide acyltransferase (E2) component
MTVEADKAAYEVPAPSGGKLIEIHAEVGSTINVGDMIAVIQT